MLKPALIPCRPPALDPIGTFSLTPFHRSQLLINSLEFMLVTYMIFSCFTTEKLLLTPVTSPLWLFAHVIILVYVPMDFNITHLTDKP
jgi:hypothetical protein